MKFPWISGSLLIALVFAPIAQADTIQPDDAQLAQADPLQNVCIVTNIQQGQLAVRNSPGGQSRAGLDNDDLVEVYRQQGNWSCVRVLSGPNQRVVGIEGWVNTNYLNCGDIGCYRACDQVVQLRSRVNARTRPGMCSR